MCGLLGLAVDLGWSYFVKKSAQASADAGALAAAHVVLSQVGQTQQFQPKVLSVSGGCASEGGNRGISNGCEYAQQSGFGGTAGLTSGVSSSVTTLGVVPSTIQTLPGVTAYFWVTARATQIIPQLFSAVLGNPTGISSARSTAAIVPMPTNGALHTLNRQNDTIASSGLSQGVDIGGTGQITVASGVVISSQAANAGSGVTVNGPVTIVSPGNASGLGASPITQVGDSGQFLDPYRDVPPPVLPSGAVAAAALPTYGVVGGNPTNGVYLISSTLTIASLITAPYPSGNYVAINCGACTIGSSATLAGTQITLQNNTTFSDSSPTCYPSSGSTFGCFLFYGGLSIASGAKLTMGAGEFVMVGGGPTGMDFNAPSGAFLDSLVSCPNPSTCSTAGTILVLTGSSSAITCSGVGGNCTNTNGDLYRNLGVQIASNSMLINAATTGLLNFGSTTLLANADSSGAAVTGLVAKNLPANLLSNLSFTLGPFDGVVLWQDQANSTIAYTANGNVNVSCGNIDNPCLENGHVAGMEALTLQANSGTGLQGVVYQPRGAFLQTGGGNIQGPIQIITGAVSMNGGQIRVTMPPTSVTRRVVTLVE